MSSGIMETQMQSMMEQPQEYFNLYDIKDKSYDLSKEIRNVLTNICRDYCVKNRTSFDRIILSKVIQYKNDEIILEYGTSKDDIVKYGEPKGNIFWMYDEICISYRDYIFLLRNLKIKKIMK